MIFDLQQENCAALIIILLLIQWHDNRIPLEAMVQGVLQHSNQDLLKSVCIKNHCEVVGSVVNELEIDVFAAHFNPEVFKSGPDKGLQIELSFL